MRESYRRVDACNRAHFYLWVSNRCVNNLLRRTKSNRGGGGRVLFARSLRQMIHEVRIRQYAHDSRDSFDVWKTDAERTRVKVLIAVSLCDILLQNRDCFGKRVFFRCMVL